MADVRSDGAGLSEAERAAVKERAAELRAEKSRGTSAAKREKGLKAVLDAIAAMAEPDRGLAETFHTIVTEVAPDLEPKTWYGMPAYAKNGKVLTFFQAAGKFDARYATFGFNDVAQLDDGALWPTAYAVIEFTDAVKATVRDLIARAVG